jgi:hypothetical protein
MIVFEVTPASTETKVLSAPASHSMLTQQEKGTHGSMEIRKFTEAWGRNCPGDQRKITGIASFSAYNRNFQKIMMIAKKLKGVKYSLNSPHSFQCLSAKNKS